MARYVAAHVTRPELSPIARSPMCREMARSFHSGTKRRFELDQFSQIQGLTRRSQLAWCTRTLAWEIGSPVVVPLKGLRETQRAGSRVPGLRSRISARRASKQRGPNLASPKGVRSLETLYKIDIGPRTVPKPVGRPPACGRLPSPTRYRKSGDRGYYAVEVPADRFLHGYGTV